MATELKRAFLLHSRPYRDSSAILDLFTEAHGRVSVVLRGLRGSSKRAAYQRGLLQPFTELACDYRGRSDLKTLTHLDAYATLSVQPWQRERLYAAMYLAELLSRVLPVGEPIPELYQHYAHTLQAVQSCTVVESPLRGFELVLLNALGFALDFSQDVDQCDIKPDAFYGYQSELGFVVIAAGHKGGVSGEDILALADADFSSIDNFSLRPEALQAAKRITRRALQPLLGDQPLQSRQLYKRLL